MLWSKLTHAVCAQLDINALIQVWQVHIPVEQDTTLKLVPRSAQFVKQDSSAMELRPQLQTTRVHHAMVKTVNSGSILSMKNMPALKVITAHQAPLLKFRAQEVLIEIQMALKLQTMSVHV